MTIKTALHLLHRPWSNSGKDLQKCPGYWPAASSFKHSGAGHDHVGSRVQNRPARWPAEIPPSTWISRGKPGSHCSMDAELPYFFYQGIGNELLAPEARIHRHDKEPYRLPLKQQERVSTGVAGFRRHSLPCSPALPDLRSDRPVQMAAGLLVDADQIGSGLFYISHVPARLLHHHMNIEHLVCHWPQLLDHRHSKGNAGHKSPVHDIQMDILRSRISLRSLLPLPAWKNRLPVWMALRYIPYQYLLLFFSSS